MNFKVITLFPEMVLNLAMFGVVGRAIENNIASLEVFNPRDFSSDLNRRVDDRPYGGGPGMVMQFEPLLKTIQKARKSETSVRVICLSAQGKPFQHADVERLTAYSNLILLAGRYEGIDERLIEAGVDEEISIGNTVVSGGELPAMMMVDALIRHIPGALGHDESAHQDSFVDGLLDCPHYTRPERINDLSVPKVLLGGDHQAIQRWREKQSLGRTFQRRPDLIEKLELSDEQKALLQEYIQEHQN
ncbi:MAG: tRNA (guanosine(37)-N1)-methyltransferase TrmD [Gammaproteobacteria bacterium]|nr:MAG: tRNA (guanosine(37)-N1)-methyltransferase TrmD [Gammaproteobacteria bacterium]